MPVSPSFGSLCPRCGVEKVLKDLPLSACVRSLIHTEFWQKEIPALYLRHSAENIDSGVVLGGQAGPCAALHTFLSIPRIGQTGLG